MTKGNSYRPTKHERKFLKGAMFKCDQREELLASVAIDCINASTEANAEVTAVASGNARTAVRASQTVVALAMNATRPRLQMQSYEATTSKSSGPAPPSQPVPKQLPWPNAHQHQESAVWQGVWRAPQAGVWQAGVWQKHRDVWEAPQEAAWRKHKEKTWWEPPPVPRQDPGSVPPGCSVRRDGETSPPGTPPAKPPAKSLPAWPPARKALEKKKDEATSADDGTACTDDPYMVEGAGPVHAESKRRRLTELASTSIRSF